MHAAVKEQNVRLFHADKMIKGDGSKRFILFFLGKNCFIDVGKAYGYNRNICKIKRRTSDERDRIKKR